MNSVLMEVKLTW